MSTRILAIVLTYYPERELLERNVAGFINEVDKVLVWENTPVKEKCRYRFIENEKVEYCGDGINSISRGLNYAWKYAREHTYDYILTMDQDSEFLNFSILKECALKRRDQKIILGPWYSKKQSQVPFVKVEALITSGMFIRTDILNVLGGYNEKLPVDGIDTDLCLRANQLKIYSYQVSNCFLQQQFGVSVTTDYKGKEVHYNVYPAKRLRSIVKSHFYLMRKYPIMSVELRRSIINKFVKGRIKTIILFEDKKMSKLYAILAGIIEGSFMKL